MQLSQLRGSDFTQGKWEFDNKMPSHLFYLICFKETKEFRDTVDYVVNKIDDERKTNDLFLLEMDYSTGNITKKIKPLEDIIHYREDKFHKFVSFFTKRRGFKNRSITVNICEKYRYACIVVNHTYADGIKMYNDLMSNIIQGCHKDIFAKEYVYKPFINEALMIKSIFNNLTMSLFHKQSFARDSKMKTKNHFVAIKNETISQIKNDLHTSFNYVCMAFVLKYIFEHSTAISLNVLVSYGFKPNERRYNNYSFVIINVKNADLKTMIQQIARDVEKSKSDVIGNYEILNNYSGLEDIFKNDMIDIVYASMLLNTTTHFSHYIVNADPVPPIYTCVLNSKANLYSNVAISIKTRDICLRNNDFSNPKMLKTSKYTTSL